MFRASLLGRFATLKRLFQPGLRKIVGVFKLSTDPTKNTTIRCRNKLLKRLIEGYALNEKVFTNPLVLTFSLLFMPVYLSSDRYDIS